MNRYFFGLDNKLFGKVLFGNWIFDHMLCPLSFRFWVNSLEFFALGPTINQALNFQIIIIIRFLHGWIKNYKRGMKIRSKWEEVSAAKQLNKCLPRLSFRWDLCWRREYWRVVSFQDKLSLNHILFSLFHSAIFLTLFLPHHSPKVKLFMAQ